MLFLISAHTRLSVYAAGGYGTGLRGVRRRLIDVSLSIITYADTLLLQKFNIFLICYAAVTAL
jgi:hypothetical protein